MASTSKANKMILISSKMLCQSPSIICLTYGLEHANTYLIVSSDHAVLIDVCSKTVVDELLQRNLIPDYVILTHEHVDHLWGLNMIREMFPDVTVIAQKECSKRIGDPKTNKAAQYHIYAVLRFGVAYNNEETLYRNYHCLPADIIFDQKMSLKWCGLNFNLIHTPGHSIGSCIVLLNDIVFSGDTMLQEETFLRFDGGNEMDFASVTLPIIDSIPPYAKIMPGHGMYFLKKDWIKYE